MSTFGKLRGLSDRKLSLTLGNHQQHLQNILAWANHTHRRQNRIVFTLWVLSAVVLALIAETLGVLRYIL